MRQRLATLYEAPKFIGSYDDARAYFSGASLRKETVFLSYSGSDRDYAARLATALRARFQQVFDYRDQGESIVPGRRWLDEVFDKLSTSAIGIALLSPSYFKSGNCAHESRQLMALADASRLRVLPVKLEDKAIELPSWMQDIQYVRGWEYSTPEKLVDKLIESFDKRPPGRVD